MILDKPVDKPAAIVTLSTVAVGRRPRAAGGCPAKVAGQQVSEVPAEPWRGQVIDLMAAFKASLEKRGVAAPTADKARSNSPLAGGARPEAHPRTAHPAVERRRAGSKKQGAPTLTGTASREPITE